MQHIFSLGAAIAMLAAQFAHAAADQAADPKVSVPQARYESAFASYVPASDIALKDWREANAEVVGGGHAGHGSRDMHSGMDHSMHGAAPAVDNGKQQDAHRH